MKKEKLTYTEHGYAQTREKTKSSKQALLIFFKSPFGTLKNTPFGNAKEKKNLKSLYRRILNSTVKILTATLCTNGLIKFRHWPGTVKLNTGIHLIHQTMKKNGLDI